MQFASLDSVDFLNIVGQHPLEFVREPVLQLLMVDSNRCVN